MEKIAEFKGFPREATQFLRDLKVNNEKAWFEANKAVYEATVQAPALALVTALGERLQAEFPDIGYDTRKNGSGSLMRIYRDTRFSQDKSPYKTNVAMMFVTAGHKKMAAPGFGLQMTPEQVELMAGQFSFDKAQLEAYRAAVLDEDKGPALVKAAEQVLAAGEYTIRGHELKRVPRGYEADHPRAEWLKHKGLWVSAPAVSLETAYSGALVDALMGHFMNMAPLREWLLEVLSLS